MKTVTRSGWCWVWVLCWLALLEVPRGLAKPSMAEVVEQEKVQKLLDRWVKAAGGARRLKSIEAILIQGRFLPTPAGKVIKISSVATAKGQIRSTLSLPDGGEIVFACDGKTGWRSHSVLGFGEMSEKEVRQEIASSDPQAPLRVKERFPSRKLVDPTVVDGKVMDVVELTDAEGRKERWFFAASNGQRVRREVLEPEGTIVYEYSDFREVEGYVEAFWSYRTQNGVRAAARIDKLTINPRIDPALFAAEATALAADRETAGVLRAYLAATGGTEAWKAVRTLDMRVGVEITTNGVKLETHILQKSPDRILVVQESGGMGKTLRGFDGKAGWEWSEVQGSRVLEGAELAQLRAQADLGSLARVLETSPFRKSLGRSEREGRKVTGIALGTFAGPAGNLYFDDETHLLVASEGTMAAGASGFLKMTTEFSDYRQVAGCLMPFRVVLINPAMRIVTTMTDVVANAPIDDAVFVAREEP